MYPLRIFDRTVGFLGEIDDYESLVFERKWYTFGSFQMTVDPNKNGVEHLKKYNIVSLGRDKTGFILHSEKDAGDNENLLVSGLSLGGFLETRLTIPPSGSAYDRVNDNVESIMRQYVDRNVINPLDLNRKIKLLVNGTNQGKGPTTFYQTRFKQLDEELEKIGIASGLGWEVVIDFENECFVFEVYEGKDLSILQDENPPVVFSFDFDNIKNQKLVESEYSYRNVGYVAGQGEGDNRHIVEVGDSGGLERREVFIDARDIENPEELPVRGEQKLAEYEQVFSFDSEILDQSNMKYGVDWDLGDIVTVQNRKWNETAHRRVTEVTESYSKSGLEISVVMGKALPTLQERIKQLTDAPVKESPTGDTGEPGVDGEDGTGLQYTWNETQLGIKREDEIHYQYVNLQGPQGIKGDTGDIGPKGDKGEKGDIGDTGDTGPQGIQGLKGDTGEPGAAGPKGDTGAMGPIGPQGETGAIGPKGDKPSHQWSSYSLRFENSDDTWGSYVNIRGAQGPQGAQGVQGEKGETGDVGPVGPQGVQGEQGPQGIQGPQGEPGTNGKTWHIGTATPANSLGVIGDLHLNRNTWDVREKTGASTWTLRGNIKGEQGIQGIQGIKGDTGSVGPQGDTGPQGLKGDKGETGNTGPIGDTGPQGERGIQGETGPIGPQGLEGPQGPAGSDANVTNENVLNAIGYTPVNKSGEEMTGPLILPASVSGGAPFRLPHGVVPSSPVNGDLWTTTTNLFVRFNGTTRTIANTNSWSTVTQIEAEAGTATTQRFWTAQRVNQAIQALQTVKSLSGRAYLERQVEGNDPENTVVSKKYVDDSIGTATGEGFSVSPTQPNTPMWYKVL
ncbi:Gp37-like protein [Bacillus solitudinis]|uniref:Gp37-like protein n=1 Tax=Bacillus solitudinis TaxID=2014074 RepID=UPI000C238D02|nr:hypothetical protein [Bacillus solitudinis]